MEDRFDATFIVRTTPDETWEVLAEGRRDDNTWWLPGFEAKVEVEEVDDGKRLRGRKLTQPCANTEIVVTVEASESGSTVTIVQSGFGTESFARAVDGLTIGWTHIVADFALYLERGVRGGRHLMPWGNLGCSVHETPAGLEVNGVQGGFAQRNGIAPGDVLLTIRGTPLWNLREFFTAVRMLREGDEIEMTWVHDRELMRATGAV
jgi:hypothetical protein